MAKHLLINATQQETRIAVMEKGRVVELFFERHSDRGIVGNIYKGKVVRVLPGMQAAFVDIGHERAAFLYAGDFYKSKLHDDSLDIDDDADNRGGRRGGRRNRRNQDNVPPIAELVKEGQEILVQVAKGPIGTKGARVTCHLSLPGRFVVYMPSLTHNGVSRKIDNYDLRKKLKKAIDQYKQKEGGFIVRTAAGNEVNQKHIKSDVDYLKNLWQKVNRKFKQNPAPKLLHYDLDLTTRVIRDHLDDDVEYFIVDSAFEHKRVLKFIRNFNPALKNKVELYNDPVPLFDRFNVENEINRALGKRVWLKSGGYLIVENTEALTSIDVNTGRFVGKKNLEETILKTNLEAAEEIVRQLRLRNVGGIIIIDFIDMERDSSKEQVYRYLENLVRDDRQKTTILKISNLGLIEMTRKRSRTPLHRQLAQSCQTCDGRGFVKSPVTVANQTLRDIRRELPFCKDDHLYVTVHPEVFSVLKSQEEQAIIALEKHYQKGIRLQEDTSFHVEQIGISPSNAPKVEGAKLAHLPFMKKHIQVEDYALDEEDQRDDENEYQKDMGEIQKYRQAQSRAEAAEEIKREQKKNPAPQVPASSAPVDEDDEPTNPAWRDAEADEVTQQINVSNMRSANDEDSDDDEDDEYYRADESANDDDVEAPVIRSSSISSEDEDDDDDEEEEEGDETTDQDKVPPPSSGTTAGASS